MSRSIYLATTEPHCGKSLISLGITAFLLRRTSRVGVFRPIAADRDVKTVVSSVRSSLAAFLERGCQVLGAVANRADMESVQSIKTALARELPREDVLLAVIPTNRLLSSPTIKEVVKHLNAEILYGGSQLDRLAYRFMVIAMRLQNYLQHLTENALLITPGDRNDVILCALQAHQSHYYPPIAGIVLIGPVLQGLRKSVNDLSRGCTVEDVINTVLITAIQAQTS